MMDLDHAIRAELDRSAGLVPVHPDPTRAARRARQRQRRRTVAVGVATAVAVTVAGIGAATLLPGDDAVLSAATQPDWAEIDWELHDGDLPAGSRVEQGPGGLLYLLSTAPGAGYDQATGDLPARAVYRSTDGITWDAAVLEDGPKLAAIDGTAELLYGITTSPSPSVGGTAVPYVSYDQGDTWRELTALPDIPPVPAEERVGLESEPWTSIDVVAGDDVVGVVRTIRYDIDREALAALLGYGDQVRIEIDGDVYTVLTVDGEVAVAAGEPIGDTTDETVEYQGVEPTVIETGNVADLGLSPPITMTELFLPDGADGWTPVDLDAADQVLTMGGDLVAVAHPDGSSGPVAVRRSPDGIAWTNLAVPDGRLTILGASADRLIGTVDAANGPALVSGDGTGAWTTTPLSGLDPALATATYVQGTAGALGAVLWTTTGDGTQWVLISSDGESWRAAPASVLGLGPDQWIQSAFVTADHVGMFAMEPSDAPEVPGATSILLGTPRR